MGMNQKQLLTTGKISQKIFSFALPMMLGNLCQQFYTATDSMIVGQATGVIGLSALGVGDWINWMATAMVIGLCQGFAMIFAKRIGENDHPKLYQEIGTSLVLGGILTLGLSVGLIVCIPIFMRLLHVPQPIIPYAMSYMQVFYAGLIFVFGYNFFASIMRSYGDTRRPFIIMVISAVCNIGLDILFVMILRWGVASAAVATVISQCIAMILSYWLLKINYDIGFHYHFSLRHIGELLYLCLPLSSMNILIAIGGCVIQSIVNTYGQATIAGFTITNKLYGLLEVAATSFGYATATFCAQNLGAKQYKRIFEGIKQALLMAICISIAISLGVFVMGRYIIMLFVDASQKEVIQIAYQYMSVLGVFLSILYTLHVLRSALQGLHDTLTPFFASMMELILRISVAMMLPQWIGLYGLYLAEVAAWIASVTLLLIMNYVQYRKIRNIHQDAFEV